VNALNQGPSDFHSCDAGKVWHAPGEIDPARWATNPVLGLRLYMDTCVVRLDVGMGKETTGFFLNFGQLF